MQIQSNPYYHVLPIRNQRCFHSRQDEIRRVVELINNQQCVSLVGLRRIGKTSLLFHLENLNRSKTSAEGMEPAYVYIDGQAHQNTKPSVFRFQIFHRICEVLATKNKSALFEEELKDEMDLAALRQAIQSLMRRGTRPVLLIDEFDIFSQNQNFDRTFFNGLRSLATRGVVFVTASKRRLYQLNLNKKTLGSPFFNYFDTQYLGLFDEKSALELIRGPSTECGVRFDERTVAEILRLAGGHPFFLQRICHTAFNMCRERDGELKEEDFETLCARSKQKLEDHMASYWEDLELDERQVLYGIAQGHGVQQESRVALDSLERRCLVVESDGSYEIFSALFEDHVRAQSHPGFIRLKKWLDRFEIVEELGQTATSVVHKARQPALDRYVAMKELKPQADVVAKDVERFRREARSIARLKHPNILSVYDFYQEGDQAYIIMEYASGGSLADQLKTKGAIGPFEAIKIVIDVGRALDYAHRHNVVHRDIKPANVFIGEDDWTLLGDFGLALSTEETPEAGLTGSIDYVAPEQLDGEADPQTDIYSLGMVLYHLLVGDVPYSEKTSAVERLAERLAHGIPAPRSRNPRIPDEIEHIILTSTAKNPEKRYKRAEEMVEALEAALMAERGRAEQSKGKASKDQYVDFEIHISADGHVIARSKEGEEEFVILTDVPTSIRLSTRLIDRGETDEDLLKELGQSFYEWLLPGPIHTHLQQTEAVARERGAKLRLRLNIEPDSLSSLPLEFIYRDSGGYFLACNPSTVLSRYLNLPLPQNYVRRREGALQLLAIIANPSDQTPLNCDEWEDIISQALDEPVQEGKIKIRLVRHATLKEIRNALMEQEPDIIQFVGHGIYQNGKGYLALVDDKTDETRKVDDEQFANMLLGFDDHLGLVSLATCESAKSGSPQGFLGIAPKIAQRGTPAVVAMQYRVRVKTAKVFLENFYTAIATRHPVDWAVQLARNAISIEMRLDNREFAAPVLYMRAKDGEIF